MDSAERLRAEHGDHIAAGANVVVIGQGEPQRAAAYAGEHVLIDPERAAYES